MACTLADMTNYGPAAWASKGSLSCQERRVSHTSMALYVKGAAQNSSSGSSSSWGTALRLSFGFISLVYVSAMEGAMEREFCASKAPSAVKLE